MLVGSDSTGEIAITDHNIRRPLALVLGNEAKGMSVALKTISDYIVNIPLTGQVNSLNVACAASIMVWQINMNSRPQQLSQQMETTEAQNHVQMLSNAITRDYRRKTG